MAEHDAAVAEVAVLTDFKRMQERKNIEVDMAIDGIYKIIDSKFSKLSSLAITTLLAVVGAMGLLIIDLMRHA